MFEINITGSFQRNLRRFIRKHPDLSRDVDRVISDLERDPFQPHLRLHRLRGSLSKYHAVRVDYSNRIIIALRVSEREITLVAIGSHDEVYR